MSFGEKVEAALTKDELDVLQRLADGELVPLSLASSACNKLGCETITNAVVTALRRGLID